MEERGLDISEAMRSAREALSGKHEGVAPLVEWLQDADWEPLQKAAVLMRYCDILKRQGHDDAVVKVCTLAMEAEYADALLTETVGIHALLARCAALERLGREHEAWFVLARGLAEHVRDQNANVYLPWLLEAASTISASRSWEDGAAVSGSLAAEAQRLVKGDGVTVSIASGVGGLLYVGGAYAAALETFDFVLERFAERPIDSHFCAALAGRQNALFALGRFDECVSACDDSIAELSGIDDPQARQVRRETLSTRELAADRLREPG